MKEIKVCEYWDFLKGKLKTNDILYVTKNKFKYRLIEFSFNRKGDEVLKYSIPKRDKLGVNFKRIPFYVMCAAYSDYKRGVLIDTDWLKNKYKSVYAAGGCNLKVIQSVLKEARIK